MLTILMQVLTFDRERAPDAVYLKTFFYTYQSFTDPELLLKKLTQKYHVRPERGVIGRCSLKTLLQFLTPVNVPSSFPSSTLLTVYHSG